MSRRLPTASCHCEIKKGRRADWAAFLREAFLGRFSCPQPEFQRPAGGDPALGALEKGLPGNYDGCPDGYGEEAGRTSDLRRIAARGLFQSSEEAGRRRFSYFSVESRCAGSVQKASSTLSNTFTTPIEMEDFFSLLI